MKEYTLLKKESEKANPTLETQEKILNVLRNTEKPISITAISKNSKTGFNETKSSIKFFHKLGIIELIVSSGNTSLVQLKSGDKNAE